jgi:PKD repeat protein
MNLKHCCGDSNNPGMMENCGMDDGVTDTPNTVGWDSCDLTGASCGSDLDNVENFMEYSYCSKMFTEGQKARMIAALNSGIADRDNLWTDSNLALTGLASPPQICAVQFNSNTRTVCAGDEVEFSDASYNGVTEWSWTFEGGVPATSEVADPVVTYDTPGLYSVGLTVGNGTETASSTEQQYVKVLPMSGLPLPFAEGFEDVGTLPSADWMVDNINGDGTFQVSATAAYTGTRSAHLGNNSSNAGHKDELLSNTIDITSDPPVVVSFRYAFALRNSSNDDVLRVYASRDCGETWTLRRTLIGSALATAPLQGGSFTPNGPEQWGYSETAPIGGLYAVSDLRLKFSFQSDGGNDLWLDDINITGATAAISEAGTPSGDALQVVPNPAGQEATLVADLAAGGPVQVDLLDILGRPVRLVADEARPAGIARWKLSLDGLPGGLYLVRLQERDAVRVVRFTKN